MLLSHSKMTILKVATLAIGEAKSGQEKTSEGKKLGGCLKKSGESYNHLQCGRTTTGEAKKEQSQ